MVEGNLEIIDRTIRKGLGTCKLCGKQPYWCYCIQPQFTGRDDIQEVGPIILAGTDGNDYSILDKVDPRIKEMAIAGKLTLSDIGYKSIRLPIRHEDGSSFVYYICKNEDFKPIKEADENTLEEAHGDGVKVLTPENKHWILRNMGFKGRGKGKWKHILFDEEIEFDLQTDTLVQLAFQIHKTGYKNAHTEWASQQKTASA